MLPFFFFLMPLCILSFCQEHPNKTLRWESLRREAEHSVESAPNVLLWVSWRQNCTSTCHALSDGGRALLCLMHGPIATHSRSWGTCPTNSAPAPFHAQHCRTWWQGVVCVIAPPFGRWRHMTTSAIPPGCSPQPWSVSTLMSQTKLTCWQCRANVGSVVLIYSLKGIGSQINYSVHLTSA